MGVSPQPHDLLLHGTGRLDFQGFQLLSLAHAKVKEIAITHIER